MYDLQLVRKIWHHVKWKKLPSLCFLAKDSMLLVGSDPRDNKQTIGLLAVLSYHIFSKSKITPSAYLSPIVSAMYFLAWAMTRSGHQLLTSSKRRKTSNELLYPSGITSSSGASLSNHCLHCFSFLVTYDLMTQNLFSEIRHFISK